MHILFTINHHHWLITTFNGIVTFCFGVLKCRITLQNEKKDARTKKKTASEHFELFKVNAAVLFIILCLWLYIFYNIMPNLRSRFFTQSKYYWNLSSPNFVRSVACARLYGNDSLVMAEFTLLYNKIYNFWPWLFNNCMHLIVYF